MVAKDIELTDLQFHPLANCWPMMEDEDFDDLVESIRLTGLRNPILLGENNLIIDGRNRYRACLIAGRKPRYEHWDGKGSLVNIIKAYNKDRRQMTASQIAASVAMMDELLKKEEDDATKRMKAGKKNPPENFPEGKGDARDKLGEQFGVSGRYISDAKKVKAEAPEVFDKVHKGEVSLSTAVKAVKEVADLPKEQRAEAASKKITDRTSDVARKPILSEAEKVIEGIESLIEKVNRMAAREMGHNKQSTAVVEHLKGAVSLVKAMQRSWRNK